MVKGDDVPFEEAGFIYNFKKYFTTGNYFMEFIVVF